MFFRKGPILSSPLFSIVSSIGVWIIILPQLAVSPVSEDGGEQVLTALQGGVLHPPGFPLQAWVNRVFIEFAWLSPATRLALVSSIGLAIAVFFLSETLRRLQVGWPTRLLAVTAYAFLPPIWAQAVQPEVFGLTSALIAALIWLSVYVVQAPHVNVLHYLSVGLLVGMAGAQHPITVIMAPAFLTSAYLVATKTDHRRFALTVMSLAFFVVIGGLYASLPALRGAHAWPDWGQLSSVKDIVRHMLRTEYGTFSLAKQTSDSSVSALSVLFRHLFLYWWALVPFVLTGIVQVWKHREKHLKWALLGSTATAAVFLMRARLPDGSPLAVAVLERFEVVALLPLAVFLGIGLDSVLTSIKKKRNVHIGAVALLSIFIAYGAIDNYKKIDLSHNQTLPIFRQALSNALPQNAIYISNRGTEAFLGVEGDNNKLRFPVEKGLIELNWYCRNVVPEIEPRLNWSDTDRCTMNSVINKARQSGFAVYSTNLTAIKESGLRGELAGLFIVAHDGKSKDYFATAKTGQNAIKLCPFIERLHISDRDGYHLLSREAWLLFQRAYEGAYEYYQAVGQLQLARLVKQVADALQEGSHSEQWAEPCRELVRLTGK